MAKIGTEIVGYVCNNNKCKEFGRAKYHKDVQPCTSCGTKAEVPTKCTVCGEEHTPLVVGIYDHDAVETNMATPLMKGTSVKGKAYYERRSDRK